MPTTKVKSPSGEIITVSHPPGATQEEIIAYAKANYSPKEPEGASLGGALEVARSIGQGVIAEPLAGLAGIGRALVGGAEAGARQVESTRNALSYAPESESGRNMLNSAAEFIQPVAEGFEGASQFFQQRGADLLSPFGKKGEATGAAIGSTVLPAAGLVVGARARLPERAPTKPKVDPIVSSLKNKTGDVDTAKVKLSGTTEKPKVVKDQSAIEVIRQGMDEGVVAAIKAASPSDHKVMLQMVDTLERGTKNARYAALNRPSDAAGASLSKRVGHVLRTNREAGTNLDKVAKTLKGQQVDFTPAVDKFLSALDDMGVRFDNGKLGFDGSDIEKLKGPQRVLKNIVDRMLNTKTPDAYDVHRLKRFIDEQVTYGKSQKGLSGKTETILKKLRRDIDGALDGKFGHYDKVNTQYADTISALDEFQAAVGKGIDLTGDNVDKALGVASRKLISNYASRTNLIDSLEQISEVAKKYGGAFDDDLIAQVMFYKELDNIFGAAAKGSFQGEIEAGVKTALREGPTAAAKDAAIGKVAEKVAAMRGINREAAIKAIRRLLLEQPKAQKPATTLPAVIQ